MEWYWLSFHFWIFIYYLHYKIITDVLMPAIFHLNLLKIRSCLYATQFMFFFIVLMPSYALIIDTASSHFPHIVSFFIEPAIFICFALNHSAYKDVPKKFFEWQIRILIKKFQDTALFWKKNCTLAFMPYMSWLRHISAFHIPYQF